ncbi:hypothetical protein [Apilactobacillus timberlakei]|uniref:hypothetical protein n=1 Tax=Apilactobacillus timberlakei TaxID=2008380 RepID=UPI0012FFE59A|nr:hypothetical protein [Apilactobacillus timberlakei]
MRLNINADTSNIKEAKEIVNELQSMPLASGMDINVNIEVNNKKQENKIGFKRSNQNED